VTRKSRERNDGVGDGVGDGVKIVAAPGVRKSVWLIAAAMALVALAALLLVRVGSEQFAADVTAPPTPPKRTAAAPVAPTGEEQTKPVVTRHARRIAAPTSESPPTDPAPARAAQPVEPPSREDAPFSMGKPGETSGIKLFPAMGTKPTKIGIVVPDDFELPEGYVRHFQAGEDGELLPAILLFHPDFEWVDDAGEPIPLPPDRVVPPELAPPGMPIEMLEVREPGGDR
jgi:hypothetical protein